MKLFQIFPILFVVYLINANSDQDGHHDELHYFRTQILENYDPDVTPISKARDKINVNFSASLISIVDLDEKNQLLVTNLVIKLYWLDKRLSWEHLVSGPKKHGDDRELILPSSNLWVPDIYVSNNADDGNKGFLQSPVSRVAVTRAGRVSWNIPVVIRSSCKVNVAYFPFDHQHCNIDLSSWTYDIDQIYLTSDIKRLETTNTIENTELQLINNKIIENKILRHKFNQKFPRIQIKIHLARKISFYTYTVIIPSILLCFLTTFTFVLPSSHGGKIEIGLTVFLFLYFLQLIISQNTPESNSMPVMGVFLFLVMTVNSISIIMSTIIVRIMYLTSNDYLKVKTTMKFPDPLWYVLNGCVDKLTFTSFEKFNQLDFGESRLFLVENESINRQKWRYLSHVLDRLLFELFFISVIITVGLLLLYVPYHSRKISEL